MTFFKKLLIGGVGLVLYDQLKPILKTERKKKNDILRKKIKYFNPVIEQSFWGTKIKWIGRENPLTDEEVEKLM